MCKHSPKYFSSISMREKFIFRVNRTHACKTESYRVCFCPVASVVRANRWRNGLSKIVEQNLNWLYSIIKWCYNFGPTFAARWTQHVLDFLRRHFFAPTYACVRSCVCGWEGGRGVRVHASLVAGSISQQHGLTSSRCRNVIFFLVKCWLCGNQLASCIQIQSSEPNVGVKVINVPAQ